MALLETRGPCDLSGLNRDDGCLSTIVEPYTHSSVQWVQDKAIEDERRSYNASEQPMAAALLQHTGDAIQKTVGCVCSKQCDRSCSVSLHKNQLPCTLQVCLRPFQIENGIAVVNHLNGKICRYAVKAAVHDANVACSESSCSDEENFKNAEEVEGTKVGGSRGLGITSGARATHVKKMQSGTGDAAHFAAMKNGCVFNSLSPTSTSNASVKRSRGRARIKDEEDEDEPEREEASTTLGKQSGAVNSSDSLKSDNNGGKQSVGQKQLPVALETASKTKKRLHPKPKAEVIKFGRPRGRPRKHFIEPASGSNLASTSIPIAKAEADAKSNDRKSTQSQRDFVSAVDQSEPAKLSMQEVVAGETSKSKMRDVGQLSATSHSCLKRQPKKRVSTQPTGCLELPRVVSKAKVQRATLRPKLKTKKPNKKYRESARRKADRPTNDPFTNSQQLPRQTMQSADPFPHFPTPPHPNAYGASNTSNVHAYHTQSQNQNQHQHQHQLHLQAQMQPASTMPYGYASPNYRCINEFNNSTWLPPSQSHAHSHSHPHSQPHTPYVDAWPPTTAANANVCPTANANTNAAVQSFGSFTSLLFGSENDDGTTNAAANAANTNSHAYAYANARAHVSASANAHLSRTLSAPGGYCQVSSTISASSQYVPSASSYSAQTVASAATNTQFLPAVAVSNPTCANTNDPITFRECGEHAVMTTTQQLHLQRRVSESTASRPVVAHISTTTTATRESGERSVSELSELTETDSQHTSSSWNIVPCAADVRSARDSNDSAFVGQSSLSTPSHSHCDADADIEADAARGVCNNLLVKDRNEERERRLLHAAFVSRQPVTPANACHALMRGYAAACQALAIDGVDSADRLCRIESATYFEFIGALVQMHSAAQFVNREDLRANAGIVRSLEVWSNWSVSTISDRLSASSVASARLATVLTLCGATLSLLSTLVAKSTDQCGHKLSELRY